jgi:hypothetical protein
MKRFITLKEMEERKEITDLQLQVRFELQPTFKLGNETIRSITYIADFTYYQNDEYIVEDCKGFRTETYKLKKKLFEYKYGIKLKEV